MRILTNFPRFPETWRTSSGVTGTSKQLSTAWDVFKHSPQADLVILDCDPNLTMKVEALYLLFPFRRLPVLSNCLVMRRPTTWKTRLTAPIKRFLLSRVDHFTMHCKILDGYKKYFGIGPDRVSYLPFKSNIRNFYDYKPTPDGEYILCFGRSERDYDCFFQAMELLPNYPAAIPPPDFAQFAKHSSRFTYDPAHLPPNVKILEDDGTSEALIRLIEKAHLVVLPIFGSRIAPSGLGTYMNSMALGKCVIITEGPGTSDVLTDEALMVPPEDPKALAAMIQRAWEDDGLRRRTAAAGQKYAESCGGEADSRQRVLDRAIEKLGPLVKK